MASKIAHKFTGDGSAHYIGIPARDLTAEEFAALDEQQQEAVTSGNLYKAIGGGQRQTPAATTEDETTDEDPIVAAVGAPNAQALKDAGFGDAAAIAAASDEDLTKVPGVGEATLKKLRALGE